MSGEKYVPQGVYLVCDKGAKPSELRSLSYKETTVFGENLCTKVDKTLIVNFDPFGPCACINGAPCTAPVTNWTNLTDGITLGGNELLLENSELPCALGGKIKIFYTLHSAMASIPEGNGEDNFWGDILDTYIDFEIGLAKGLWKGLKGTAVGLYDLTIWAGKHTTPYMLLNPGGFQEQLQKDKETFTALGNAAAKGGTWMYRNSAVNMLTDPEDFYAAHEENVVMMDKLMDKAENMSTEEWGDLTGQLFFEIALEVVTAGGAAALTAVKVGDKGLDVVKAVNAFDNLADGAKVLENADNLIDGGRALENAIPPVPEQLGDVTHLVDDVPKKPNKPRKPSKDNPNIDHKKTTKNADGSTTYYDLDGNSVTYSKDGYPDFSEYSEIEFDVKNMDGTDKDFSKVYKKMKEDYGFKTQKEAKEWLSSEGLTPHHHSNGKKIQLVDKSIHDKFPHTGGAANLRNN